MIYFDKNKQAYAYEIENPLFTCDEKEWQPYSTKTLGKDYDITEKGFVDIEPSLNELKEAKRSEINQARDEAEQGGFEYMGKVFDSDQISAQRISMAAQAMALADDTAKITWTCQDNTTIDLTAQELVGLVVALAKWSNSCHQKATALKAQIDAAKTAEELEKIQWNAED